VLKTSVADDVASILSTVVTQGTAKAAQIPGRFVAGKTGTTENYGDAWFVGWTDEITVAVWVGYPDELRPMETEFRGQPVAGGTYPASIWKTFVERAMQYEAYGKRDEDDEDPTLPSGTTAPATPGVTEETAPTTPAVPETTAPAGDGGAAPAPETDAAPEQQAPATEEAPAPAAPPAEQPATGEGGGVTAPG
jgi:penicillin-binding protein 1A